MTNNGNFYLSFVASLIIHFIAMYIIIFGLPYHSNNPKVEPENIIAFEMLNINELNASTQQPAAVKQIVQEIKAIVPKEPLPEPVKQPNPPPPQLKEEIPKIEEVIVPPQVLEKPKVNPEQSKIEQKPKQEVEKPVTKEKEIDKKFKNVVAKKDDMPKTQEKKKAPKQVINDDQLDSLLKTLEVQSASNPSQAASAQSQASSSIENSANQLSLGHKNIIYKQIYASWENPLKTISSDEISILVHVKVSQDGTIKDVRVIKKSCNKVPASVCQALVDSAERAIFKASPLKDLDITTYNNWREFNINFDPSEIN